MYVLQQAKQQVLTELKQAVKGLSPTQADLATPPDPSMGDIAFPCFALAKQMKQAPDEIAREIAAKIGSKGFIERVNAVGPYVNFIFSNATFGSSVLGEIQKLGKAYGVSTVGEEKRVMVEYANLNSHKDVHIGHLRNLFVGQMAVEVLKMNGYDVVPVAYINDLGVHVAKSVWAMKKYHGEEQVPKEDRIKFLREVYVEANAKLEEDPSLKEEVSQVFLELENQRGEDVARWKETRDWSIDYLRDVYDELGLTLEHWYFESDLILKTKKIIDQLIEDGLAVESEGAWIVDLRDEDLGVNLLIKSDGTLLYNAKDLGLAMKKEEDYHPLRSIYVVDMRQSHALKQLFATLKRMEFDRELIHLAYDFVTLSDGAMAARKGNVVRYEVFRDEMIARAHAETRERHEDWSLKKVNTVSRAVAFAAIRFGMLKQDLEKSIVFDLEQAMSFEGYTGPYLLYTYARIQRLFTKVKKIKLDYAATKLTEPSAHDLMILLSSYPEVVFSIGQTLQLSRLPQYLFDLAKTFSAFYNDVPIATAEPEIAAQRLALSEAVQQVLENGMELMGITPVDEM
ncbi:arginine--tRNA ligase [Candidatus Uhrbacteria bacterium CG_4_9_14_3_um_filter_50_9]|uniref:Arginine--tRNA ligase n=1 Tax=Candidatus Uhrbacteria bacterium CG_4_9_14_3_um_filter_50_9 TaxID=1975035 RepID=A0A2M7XB41_9BACT|nr:MAG: arginine--tRNA ligase [Candidatus Uhrbacteria bacterium CG_4_9_14_3_um_filter_50_9]